MDRKDLRHVGVYVYRLEARDEPKLVRTEESFEGWLARLLRRQLRKTLQEALNSGLRRLKIRSKASRRSSPDQGAGPPIASCKCATALSGRLGRFEAIALRDRQPPRIHVLR
jgi:hypothetical protein